MEKSTLDLRAEPRGDVYRQILDYSLGTCATFLLVYRWFPKMSEPVKCIRNQISPFVIDESVVSAWPGTILFEASAVLGRYSLEHESAAILKQAAEGLFEWGGKGSGLMADVRLPDDLCLMRPDGTPWLVTIGHEADGYFRVTGQERSSLLKAVPRLGDLLE